MTDIKQKIVNQIVQRLEDEPLGDLLTEAELKDVVSIAIQEVFFKERLEKKTYGSDIRHPPLIFEAVKASLNTAAEKAIGEWMRDNAVQVAEYWTKVLDQGIESYVMQMQDAKAKAVVQKALDPMLKQLNEERAKLGLPYVYIAV